MMTAIPQVIWTYIEALKKHDVAAIAATVSNDLAFVTPTTTLTRDQFLQMLRALSTGFPNWRYRHDPSELRDGTVAVKWQQGGTHTGPFSLPGIATVPAIGRSVQIPAHYFFYTVRDGGIAVIRPNSVPGGAPGGILEQIGIISPPL